MEHTLCDTVQTCSPSVSPTMQMYIHIPPIWLTYIYTYTHTYVSTYIYIFCWIFGLLTSLIVYDHLMNLSICIQVCICSWRHILVYMDTYIHTLQCINISICSMYVYIYIHTYICFPTLIHRNTFTHSFNLYWGVR